MVTRGKESRKVTVIEAVPLKTWPSDSRLAEMVASGDREAFAMLIRRHQEMVLSIAYRFSGDRSEAEDISQEVFIRFWGAAKRYRPDKDLRAYLRTIAVNLCLDHRRKSRFTVLSLDDRPGTQNPHRDLEAAERKAALDAAIQELPPAQRMAVVLFHMENLTVREAACALDTSPKAVESLLSRARAALREKLARHLSSIPLQLQDEDHSAVRTRSEAPSG